ncbi:ATP-binding protein [Streptomyces sp. RB110-1]|uniref:ATP-binding protein n=1 Tax=unclassified Streptomyces TaxID=2593676 RepID=UPI0019009AC8|nr:MULTISPECIES: ATP-binding protein [unclassified Streptomyces]MBK0376214.1 ATP-binding protein [Streptomyces sp. RB110-1]MBK0387412.1 ATP-binding protein [Streptomyces sp. RB110-2]
MPPEALVSRLELVAQPDAVRSARHHARDVLNTWRVSDDAAHWAALTVSELVTNAVQHATRSVPPDRLELTLRHSHVQLLVEVADPDTRPPVRADVVPSTSECGRGLQLVESVSKEWGYYRPPAGGKVVWCALAVNAQQFS